MSKNYIKMGIIVPCYNEGLHLYETIHILINEVKKIIKIHNNLDIQILLIDDGSIDNTWNLIKKIKKKHPSIINGHSLFYNVGKDRALFSGLVESDFDIYLLVDADNEHPYNQIETFVKTYIENKCDTVIGIRKGNKNLLRIIFSNIYYLILKFVSGINLKKNSTEFRLFSKELKLKLLDTYLYPYFLKSAFDTITHEKIYVEVNYNTNGLKKKSSFDLKSLINLFFLHLTFYTLRPLRIFMIINLFFIFISIFNFFNFNLSLFISLISINLSLMAILFSQYIINIYERSMRKNPYQIKEKI